MRLGFSPTWLSMNFHSGGLAGSLLSGKAAEFPAPARKAASPPSPTITVAVTAPGFSVLTTFGLSSGRTSITVVLPACTVPVPISAWMMSNVTL